jgi:hypothetical protein
MLPNRDVQVQSGSYRAIDKFADLSQLAAGIKNEVNLAEQHFRDSVVHALKAGEYLVHAKHIVEHGEWQSWFKSQDFSFCERTAQRYMRFYKKWQLALADSVASNPTELSDLTVSDILKLHTRQLTPKHHIRPDSQASEAPRGLQEEVALGETEQPSIDASKNALRAKEPQPCDLKGEALTSDDEWLTPRILIEAAGLALGRIDLDPAADGKKQIPASQHYTTEDDGLKPSNKWQGSIFLNPPVDKKLIECFCLRLHREILSNTVTEAILLVPARTNEAWFRKFSIYERVFIGKSQFGSIPGMREPIVAIYHGLRTSRFFEVFCSQGDGFVPYRVKPSCRLGDD